MSRKTDTVVARTIGIDTGKNTPHLIGLDDKGAVVLREKLSRGRIAARLANVPQCLIGIEAGMATDCVARELIALGHDGRAGAAGLCRAVPSRSQERFPAIDPLRSGRDRRSAGSASPAPRAISPDQRADRCDQSDPRLSFGARYCSTPRASLSAAATPGHLG